MKMDLNYEELEYFVKNRTHSNDLLLQDQSLQHQFQISRIEILEELRELDAFTKERNIELHHDDTDSFLALRFQTNMVLIRSEKLREYFKIPEERVVREIQIHQKLQGNAGVKK